MSADHHDLDQLLDRFEYHLPARFARMLRWLRKPSSMWVRFPVAFLLIFCGFLGFLPILGFWMLPLGLILIAQDLPFLKGPLARLLGWIERKWFRTENVSPPPAAGPADRR